MTSRRPPGRALFRLADLVDLDRLRVRPDDSPPGISSHAGTKVGGRNAGRPSHNGVDIRLERGAPIYCPADGVVVVGMLADLDDPYGNGLGLILRMPLDGAPADARTARVGMCHLSGISGRIVQQRAAGRGRVRLHRGELLGWVGSTGRSTGPHIHLTVTDPRSGDKVDPLAGWVDVPA